MNIGMILLVIIGGSTGLLTTAYLVFSIPAVLIYKLYRKLHFGISMMK